MCGRCVAIDGRLHDLTSIRSVVTDPLALGLIVDEMSELDRERAALQAGHRANLKDMMYHHLDAVSAGAEELGLKEVEVLVHQVRAIIEVS